MSDTMLWSGTGYSVQNVRDVDDFDLSENATVSANSFTVISGTAAAWGGSGRLVMVDHKSTAYGVWACWADDKDHPIGFFVARCSDHRGRLTDDQLIDDAMRHARARRDEQIADIQRLLDAPIGSLDSDGPHF